MLNMFKMQQKTRQWESKKQSNHFLLDKMFPMLELSLTINDLTPKAGNFKW